MLRLEKSLIIYSFMKRLFHQYLKEAFHHFQTAPKEVWRQHILAFSLGDYDTNTLCR